MAIIKLSELNVKESCLVHKITGNKAVKKRLLEMGFVRGTKIYVEKVALLDGMKLKMSVWKYQERGESNAGTND